jgi:hypothetical protein
MDDERTINKGYMYVDWPQPTYVHNLMHIQCTVLYYSRRGKNWPVAIKKAYKVKEKTVWQKNCLLTGLYISAVHFLRTWGDGGRSGIVCTCLSRCRIHKSVTKIRWDFAHFVI